VRSPLAIACVLAACHPSATVENTMPIANLQTYRTVAVRVHSTAFASQGRAMQLEAAMLDNLKKKCGFEQVVVGQTAADILLDLNITQAGPHRRPGRRAAGHRAGPRLVLGNDRERRAARG